ncbi:MAG: DMT family transporter [Chitinophagaceae bacterium]
MQVVLLKRIKSSSFSKRKKSTQLLFIIAGFSFAILWSSASTATKIGLEVAQPFMIAIFRFFIAGTFMLLISHLILGNRIPSKKEWSHIMIYGFLNITLYLGCYVFAMQNVSAGLGSLAVAANPVFINILLVFWMGQKIKSSNLFSLLLCLAGVLIAAWPLLHDSLATVPGILILLTGMVAYSAGAIYYSKVKWNGLNNLTINAWQTLFGGLFLLPVMLLTYKSGKNVFDARFFKAVCWLAFMVSLCAVQIWLYLLKNHLEKGFYWLFLCPVSGFIIAAFFTHEPLGWLTAMGVALVIAGLYLTLKQSTQKEVEVEVEEINQ